MSRLEQTDYQLAKPEERLNNMPLKGYKQTEEHRRKTSESKKGKKFNFVGFKGKKHSKETKFVV